MSNLVQNPSFEAGLTDWVANNVSIADFNPFEGTAAARMGPGIASLFQDVDLRGPVVSLLLSFAIEAPFSFNPGNLTVQVKWLDHEDREIGVGLCLFIPSATVGFQVLWLTYVDVTENAPKNAVKARIIFSKQAGGTEGIDVIDVDKVVLSRVVTLIKGVNC